MLGVALGGVEPQLQALSQLCGSSYAALLPVRLQRQAVAQGVALHHAAHIDTVSSASRAAWEPLLSAGATIAQYKPTMYHCKLIIVDGLLTSVG